MNASSSSRLVFVVFVVFVVVFFLTLSVTSISAPMAEEPTKPLEGVEGEAAPEEAAVHIVYVDLPEGGDPKEFHIRTLASVLGSEEAAKDVVIYHYTHAASGFSAKLTPKQVKELEKQPGVLQVIPSRTYQLHGKPSTTTTATTQRINIL